MKTTKTWLYGLALTIAATTIAGCFGGSSTPADVVVAPPARADLAVALQTVVKDAATGLPITPTAPEKVTLVVYGADANKVVDINGVSLYSAANGFAGPVAASSGLFTIYLKPGTPVPSKMSLRLVASAKGFVNSSENMQINSTDLKADGSTTAIDVNIPLVSQTAPPPSVVVAATPVTLTNSTTAAISTTTKTADSTTVVNGATVNLGSATVVIPPTTVVYADAAKTVPLPAGTTSVNVSYNNNTTATSLATFPGGLTTSQSATGAPLATPSIFIAGGFASIEVSSTATNGTVTMAKTFDKPLAVTISIPKGTMNPQTGLPATTGDTIPIWSFDSTTGAWSVLKLTNGTIVSGTLGALDTSNNTFPVPFTTDHLTYMSAAWVTSADQQCSNAAINIAGALGKALNLQAIRTGNGWFAEWTLDADAARPSSVSSLIGTAPKNTEVKIVAYQGAVDPANLVGSVTVPDLCASGITLNVTPKVTPLASVDVNVRDVCLNDTTKFTNAADVSVFANSAGGSTNALTGTNGVGTLADLIVGGAYQISVPTPYDFNQSYTVLASGNSIQVTRSVTCTTAPPATGGQ